MPVGERRKLIDIEVCKSKALSIHMFATLLSHLWCVTDFWIYHGSVSLTLYWIQFGGHSFVLVGSILFTHMTCPAKVPHCLHVKYPFRRFMNEQLIFVRARLVPLCGNICLRDVNQPTTHQHEGMTTKLDSIVSIFVVGAMETVSSTPFSIC
jgi:hypothetical protein